MASGHDWADFLQRFSTKVLWHFTGYSKTDEQACQILHLIIKNKTLELSPRPEPVIMLGGERRWVYSYSCMCDIPFKDLRIHTYRYGKYGIAFHRDKAIRLGNYNPVLYVHKNSVLFKRASEILPEIDKLTVPHKVLEEKITKFLALLGTFVKPSNLTAPISIGNVQLDKEQNNNFYYEREWRSAFRWLFEPSSVAAVMVPQKDFEITRALLDTQDFINTPVIPSEMVDKL